MNLSEKPLNAAEKTRYAALLWQEVELYLTQNWKTEFDDFSKIAPTWHTLPDMKRFGNFLHTQIQKRFQSRKVSTAGIITIERLIDLLVAGGLTGKSHNATLNMFAIYIGYETGWPGFVARKMEEEANLIVEGPIPKLSTFASPLAENDLRAVPTSSLPTTSFWKQRPYFLWMALPMAGLLVIAIFSKSVSFQTDKTPGVDTTLFIKCINQACKAEFIAYQKLPDKVDTIALQKIFTKDGAAYKRIKNVLLGNQQKRQGISNEGNPSTYEITSARFVKVEHDMAHLETEEYWFLKWFSDSQHEYVKGYKEHNRQMYILVKEAGRWKVKSNYYDGHNYTISPNKPLNQLH